MLHKYYSILGLPFGADKKSIKSAFRRLVMVFHPDRGPECRQRFIEINEAYDALMNSQHIPSQDDYSELKPNVVNMDAARDSACRRASSRGNPGMRRFECVQQQEYIGTKIKAQA